MSDNKETIIVDIVDDHQMVIDGLIHMLSYSSHIHVQSTYLNGQSLLAGLEKKQPDIILLDIHLTDYVGEDLIPIITGKYPHIRIIIVSSMDTIARVRQLVKLGCSGYLLKNVQHHQLISAIEKVYHGDTYITDELKERLVNEMFELKKELPVAPLVLTYREKEVLQLIAQEFSSQEIADKLFISKNTVEIHRKHLFQKLDVKNVAGLVRKAILSGLVK